MIPTDYKSRYPQSEESDIRENRPYASPCSLYSPEPPYTSAPAPATPAASPWTATNATPHARGPPTAGKARSWPGRGLPPDNQSSSSAASPPPPTHPRHLSPPHPHPQ